MHTIAINKLFGKMHEHLLNNKKLDGMQVLEAEILKSQCRPLNDREMELQFWGDAYVLRTHTLPWYATADGGIVTDWCLHVREFLQFLCAPMFNKRFTVEAKAVAEWVHNSFIAMMQGGEGGGAVYAFGKWHLSARWVAIAPPQLLPVKTALYDDPFVCIARSLIGDNLKGENAAKAMKIAVDPWYHQFRISSSTIIKIPPYQFIDVQEEFDGWGPTCVHNGGDAMDVVTRAGTYVPDDETGDWRSSAFCDHAGPGRVLGVLQPPVLFDQRGIGTRLGKDGEFYWFRRTTRDVKLQGIKDSCVPLLDDLTSLKLSWLSQRLGMKMQPGASVTALYVSPLFFINQESRFIKTPRTISERWTVLSNHMSWLRSDPSAPQALLRFASASGGSVSVGWLTDSELSYVRNRKWI